MYNKKCRIAIFLSLVMLLVSCSDNPRQETSRIVPSSNISTSIESTNRAFSYDSNSSFKEEVPSESSYTFDADVRFSDHYTIVNYGKSRVNVYQAKYAQPAEVWDDTWLDGIGTSIRDWAMGYVRGIYLENSDSMLFLSQNREVTLMNLMNVREAKLCEIDGHEVLEQKLGIGSDSAFLCWTLVVKDFPKDAFAKLNPDFIGSNIDEIESIQYACVGAQYIDGLPVTGYDHGTRMCITYDWPGMIQPSRLAYYRGAVESLKVNPSRTAVIEVDKAKYTVTRTLSKDQPVVSPEDCIDEIRRSLAYRPETNGRVSTDPQKADLLDVWGKKIDIFCAELSYMALDPSPRDSDESEESLFHHELTIVPVWEVYYTISNPENETTVEYGSVSINAVTGKSMYSNEVGADENYALYPELLSKG